jgi:hypothetical protein
MLINKEKPPVIHQAQNYMILSKLVQQQSQHPILLSKQALNLPDLAVYLHPQIFNGSLCLVQCATLSHLVERQLLHSGGDSPALGSYGEQAPQHAFLVVLRRQSLNHRVRKFPLVEIFATCLLAGVFGRGEIDEVVSDLVEPADQSDQGFEFFSMVRWCFLIGVADQKTVEEVEETSGLAVYHGEVFVGGWAGVVFGPEEVVALADEETPQRVEVDVQGLGSELARLFCGFEDCEVG